MSLQLYLDQLTEDLRTLSRNPRKSEKTITIDSEESFLEHIRDVENYLHGKQEPLSEIVGIASVQFPPASKLSERQQAELYKEMEALLSAYNFYPDFPQKLPDHFKYAVMLSAWDKEHVYMESGQSHLEFCDYEPERCPFPKKYCACRDFDGK